MNPKLTMENCKTIVMVGVPYERLKYKDDLLQGKISCNAIEDYHVKVKEKLEKLSIKIKINKKNIIYKNFVDTGPLSERIFAVKSGLGFFGENKMVINEKYGSFFNIGYILLDDELPSYRHNREDDKCFECMKCIKKCPSNSLNDDGNFTKCISFLTQTKEFLTIEKIKVIGNNLYGCDICQDVCPHNDHINIKYIDSDIKTDLKNIIKLTNKDYKKLYGETGLFWRGKKVLQRNGIISMFNINPSLINNISDDRSLIKEILKEMNKF